jgi:hypothetical protein
VNIGCFGCRGRQGSGREASELTVPEIFRAEGREVNEEESDGRGD